MIYDVAVGMKEIYKKGVEHRDLKTDNVLLDNPRGELIAKVCDFGLAKCASLSTHTASNKRSTLLHKYVKNFSSEKLFYLDNRRFYFNHICNV